MTMVKSSLQLLFRSALILLLTGALVACGEEEDVATETEGVPPDLTPEASDELMQGVEEVDLVIVDGDFEVGELVVQQGEATVIHVTNQDDEAYRFEIDGLVSAQEIAADSTTDVEFTTPNAGTHTGQLLGEDDDTVLAEVTLDVRAAGGVSD